MSVINISDVAYDEFKAFLDSNDVKDYKIRINLAGFGCSGPAFNITLGGDEEGDIVEQVKDITFLIKPELIDDFKGFTITGTAENGRGLSLEPLENAGGGCGSCGGGCGH